MKPLPSRRFARRLALGLALALLAASTYAQPVTARVDTEQSTLSYTGHHLTHSWTGTSRQVTGTLTLDVTAPELSRITIRVPTASFDSGSAGRDANLLRVVEAEAYPDVAFVSESVAVDAWARTSGGYEGQWRVRGRLTFHGRSHPAEIPVVVRITNGQFEAEGAFPVSLKAFKVRRPRLLMVPVQEAIDLKGTIRTTLPAPTATR